MKCEPSKNSILGTPVLQGGEDVRRGHEPGAGTGSRARELFLDAPVYRKYQGIQGAVIVSGPNKGKTLFETQMEIYAPEFLSEIADELEVRERAELARLLEKYNQESPKDGKKDE